MYAIGVDIGGTKIACALIDGAGSTHAVYRVSTRAQEGADAVIDRIESGVRHLLERAGDRPVVGVGVGCPGYVDAQAGIVHKAVNLDWEDLPLADILTARLEAPRLQVRVANDAVALAQGEATFGAGRGCDDFVLVAVGTGLGLAARSGGRMLRGSSFAAMELAHVALVSDGRPCACGLKGCLEMYCSGVGMLAAAREYLPQFPDSSLHAVDPLTTPAILEAADAGDALGGLLVREITNALVNVSLLTVGILNPRRVIIGGGLGQALVPRIIDDLRAEVTRRTHPAAHDGLTFASAEVASSAAGAAALILGT
jgi:glucokinase